MCKLFLVVHADLIHIFLEALINRMTKETTENAHWPHFLVISTFLLVVLALSNKDKIEGIRNHYARIGILKRIF